jgi:hypothetical protein
MYRPHGRFGCWGGGGEGCILFKIGFSQIEFSWISVAQVRIKCWAL